MKKFKKIYIEITNICNLSCNFCPKTKRKLKFMDVKDFSEVIMKIKGFTDYVYFHLMGEPFLNKNLPEFLNIAAKSNLKVNITTNGTMINEVKDTLINSAAVRQINFSLHSFEANDQGVDFYEYIKNICSFIREAKEKTNIICSIRLWNMDTIELKANNNLNYEIFSLIENELELDFNLKEVISTKHRMKLKNNVYLNMAEKFEWPNIDKESEDEEIFCYGLRDQIGILVDGTIVPCCLDSEANIPLGNIFKEDLENILNSERAKNIYDGFSRRKAVEELCKKCGYAKRYKK